MCDRILLFSNNPGRIIREIGVDLPSRAIASIRSSAIWLRKSTWR